VETTSLTEQRISTACASGRVSGVPVGRPGGRLARVPRFHVQQKITPFQNTYRVFGDVDGQPGPLIAYAKQKRMAFKEQFTLYGDESGSPAVLTIAADRRIDVRSTMTVRDPAGAVVGQLRKKGAASLLRSTWELDQPGLPPGRGAGAQPRRSRCCAGCGTSSPYANSSRCRGSSTSTAPTPPAAPC
jgi:hypothetical protein